MAIQTMNPATGEVLRTFEEHSGGEVERRLARAEVAYRQWRGTKFEERAALMMKAADLMRREARRYAELCTVEMGKPIIQALGEIEKCAWICEFYAEKAESFLAPRTVKSDARRSFVSYEPIGPVLAVMPWNFPFYQVIRFAAPALMAGNVGVLKHASNVPQSALAIEEIFREAGFPQGAFTTLLVSSRAVEGVIRDRRVRAVTLTGSEAAGMQVAATAGEELKKSVLELGGSDPFIVLADADVGRAARTAAQARLINSGQSCIAAKRFIVVREAAEEFIEKFKESLSKARVGDPMEESTEVGPLARTDLRGELHDQVTASTEAGASCLLGGEIPDGPGAFYPVTLLTGARPGVAAYDRETFGPVAAVRVVESEGEAVEAANASVYGLGASLWTADPERAAALAGEIEAGSVFVNGLVKSDPRLPFGGVKRSGYGRELAEEGIREFVNVKTVWIADL